MRKLLNPKWLFLINTLPISILLFLEWNEYQIIKTLLDDYSTSVWSTLAFMLIVLAACNIVYTIVQMIRKRRISLIYSTISFLAYTIYIYIYYYNSDKIISSDIPNWMISGNLHLYVGAFLMPTIIHSLFSLVIYLTDIKEDRAWVNFAIAVSIPVLFYVFGVLLAQLWRNMGTMNEHFFVITIILITATFLFFLIRFMYILISNKDIFKRYEIIWKILIGIAFPISGLIVNDHVFDHMFGNFSSPWFYVLAVANGILICIPFLDNKRLRLFVFLGRCTTFTFTLYFFLIMLPFLPFSVFAIVLFGSGFLMLTPLLLFPIHINELVKDFKYLKRKYNHWYLYLTALIGLLILPTCITISYLYDRSMLFKTLDYIYSADYEKEYELDSKSILKTIEVVDGRTKSDVLLYSTTPFLSSYYKWLVLDNLNLSEGKKRLMKNLFEGTSTNTSSSRVRQSDIKVTDIKHRSKFDEEQNAWVSWIDLSITNNDTPLWDAEYITQIDLPEGCWISDYYLYVDSVKEMGILAEKKAATWVFNQIRNENRDPGLLRYISGNKVEFKVFPFQEKETRYTGIEFIHKEPVQMEIDGNIIQLGDVETQLYTDKNIMEGDIMYISANKKQTLETTERTPYYHFVVDMSQNREQRDGYYKSEPLSKIEQERRSSKYIQQIGRLLDRNLISKENARISYTNSYVNEMGLKEGWKDKLKEKEFKGGFFLDRAIKKILFETYQKSEKTYPVIVVVSENLNKAILFNDLTDIQFTYPESELFYSLQNDSLISHRFSGGLSIVDDSISELPVNKVKVWENEVNSRIYLPDNNKPSIVLNTKNQKLEINQNNIKEKDWYTGLQMQGQWMLQNLYPETADKEWLNLLQNSFKSRIMSPLTSYIVVENEAQKAILKKKQEEVLSGKRTLDLTDDTQRMSEPDIYILLAILIFFYMLYRRRKKKILI